eukprot:CAMPEP_0195512668 /NCGR_PEP_ID=MMETSP0794_2-20130614/4553_1 /TAXON_ID=515487 /ORGANISM="Stephanopyxis turris, Strain CCMP 815" /LENGTH=468 /DNA_ID=CAMNT_0040640511 /DNA_START=122 /DNA_END=1528 /DNA_ORIENTATION=+
MISAKLKKDLFYLSLLSSLLLRSSEGNNVNCPIKPQSSAQHPPLVIGHRGASFNLPEHTLAGYRLALEMGADYIEPDLVPTKDKHLVAVHNIDLNITTNIAKVFPDRFRIITEKSGSNKTGYFVQDFTLSEVRQLRVEQRVKDTPARSRFFDGLFPVPTLVEIIDLLAEWTYNAMPVLGRNPDMARPGLYIELKSPSLLLEDAEIKVEDLLIETIKAHPHSPDLFFNESRCASLKRGEYIVPPLVMQNFEYETLAHLRSVFEEDKDTFKNVIPPSILIVSHKMCQDPEPLWNEIRSVKLDGVAPEKSCLLEGKAGEGRDFMNTAFERNLAVHPWTERAEIEFVKDRFVDAASELSYLFCDLKVKGIFAENVDVAIRVVALGCEADKKIEEEEIVEEELQATLGTCGSKKAQEWLLGFLLVLSGFVAASIIFLLRAAKRQLKMSVPSNDGYDNSVDVGEINDENENEII